QEVRDAFVAPTTTVDHVPFVTPEHFVAAVAGKRHGHVLAGHLRDDVSRNARHVGERLVVMPYDLFDQTADVRRDDELVMIGAEVARGDSRVAQLVEAGVGKTYRERLHLHLARHHRDDDARIDPAGKERAERDLTLQSHPDGFGDQLAQSLDVAIFARLRPAPLPLAKVAGIIEVPITARVD